jgi:Ni/Fe-hydrogenase subunit HybB-like protein
MKTLPVPRITVWRALVIVILALGAYGTYVRFFQGLGSSTNLSDAYPWGLWVGLNTLCGVGLSAGGFAIAAAVYILGLERYRPVLRAAILIALLGYLSVVTNMLFELGLPWRIWHPIFMWNRASVLFEVAWCVMLYTTVLLLEFSPTLFERLRWHRLRAWHRRILIGLVLVGVLLSSLHQSFLGGLYLIAKGKLYPLWYSSQLPALFFLSAIPAGLALTLMALYLCNRSFPGVCLDRGILSEVGRVVALLLAAYGLVRIVDIVSQGAWTYLWRLRPETGWFWLEITLFVLLPLLLLSQERVRNSPLGLYWSSVSVVMGFMANRLNVAINGLQASAGVTYVPKWTEFVISLSVIVAAVVVFRFAALHLKILPRTESSLPTPLQPGTLTFAGGARSQA